MVSVTKLLVHFWDFDVLLLPEMEDNYLSVD